MHKNAVTGRCMLSGTHLKPLYCAMYNSVMLGGTVLHPDTWVEGAPQGPHKWLRHLHLD